MQPQRSTIAPETDKPSSVLEVCPGVFAVGAGVPAAIPVSWIPRHQRGWTPVQCFLFQNGGESLLMDSGLVIHRAEVAAGVAHVLGGERPRMLVSRWEPDAMVNLPWMIDAFGIREIYSYGGINPLDFFESFEGSAARIQAKANSGPAQLIPIMPGDVLSVGTLRIEVLTASLRLLLASWFYEHTTRSLFTADSFGFWPNPDESWPVIVRPSAEDISPDIVREGFRAKFDWLSGAHPEAVVADLKSLHATHQIDRVCPSFGAIIEGKKNVARLFDSTIAALEQLGREKRRSALEGFNWERAMSPKAVVDIKDLPRPVLP